MNKLHVLFLIPLFLFLSLFDPTSVHSQIPSNTNIKCDETTDSTLADDEEFHSLRPYQANTQCSSSVSDYATYCGTDLTLTNTIDIYYPGTPGDCTTKNGKIYCTYNIDVNKSVTINLSGAELPIMGNTEDVINSQSSEESFDDAQKMNEYVSWYLNGVTNRTEYGSANDTDQNFVNYSGPLKKLLPQAIQQAQQIEMIESAKETQHDKVVVCTSLSGDPVGCHDENSVISNTYRLTEWESGGLGITRGISNILKRAILNLLPNATSEEINRYVGVAWNKRTPPLPWNEQFENEKEYLKAYREWQGDTCALIPVINQLICVKNPLVKSKYAELFPYISLSSTEDVEGNIKIDNVSSSTNLNTTGVTVKNITFSNQLPSTLFLPHMVEADELGSLLQDTYIPQGEEKVSSPTNISDTSCSTVEVRSNAGDDLFANQLTGDLSYTAGFTCIFNEPTTEDDPLDCMCINGNYVGERCGSLIDKPCDTEPLDCMCYNGHYVGERCGSLIDKECIPQIVRQKCSKKVYINLSTQSNIPLVDDVWSRLVAGSMSVFKRIFPKTNTEGGVGKIIDIAGSSNITYSGTDMSESNTDLKIPHVGGVSEYFLKGIQTALRPKGYGEQIAFAENDIIEDITNTGIDCDQTAADVSSLAPKLISKEDLHEFAIAWEGREGDHVLECYNDVVRKSIAANVNPAFTLLLWVNESGASNYEISNQDFGINSSKYRGFTAQINEFFELMEYYKTAPQYASCFGKGRDTEMFFSIYYYGYCNIDKKELPPKAEQYMELMDIHWNTMTSCNFTGYPFSADCY